MHRFTRIALLALALVALPVAARAASYEITGFVGTVMPTDFSLLEGGGGTILRNQTHLSGGLGLGMAVNNWLGLELRGEFGSGETQGISGGEILQLASTVAIGELRGRARLMGGENAELGLLAGLGWIQYRNTLFEAANEIDDSNVYEGQFFGSLGLGMRARLTERLRLSIDLVDRIHEEGLDAPNFIDVTQPTQHDIGLTFGLTVPLN